MVCYIWLAGDCGSTNLYLAQFIQISATSSKSTEQFHVVLHQNKLVSKYMTCRTGVTMESANENGCSIRDGLCALDAYIGAQLENDHDPVRIVCHCGWHHLFLIFALTIERVFGNNYLTDLKHLNRANYIDFGKVLVGSGITKPSLANMCKASNIVLQSPPDACNNVTAMKQVGLANFALLETWTARVTIEDLMHHAWEKLPFSLGNVLLLAKIKSHEDLSAILYERTSQKSALKKSHVTKIVNAYKALSDSSEVYKSLWQRQPTLELTQLMESPYA